MERSRTKPSILSKWSTTVFNGRFLLCNINEVLHLASSTCAPEELPEEDERKRQMAQMKKTKQIVTHFSFQNIGVSYSSGEASKSWMYEWRSKAITIRAVVVCIGSLCPVSEFQCSSECVCVCVHFKRAINMAKWLASKNSLQMLSYSATPDPSTTKNVNSFQRWVFWEKNCSCETWLTDFNPHFQHPRRGIVNSHLETAVMLFPVDYPRGRITEVGDGVYRVEGHKATPGPRSRWQWDIRPALVCFCSLVANQYH